MFGLDVGDYRERREQSLEQLAERMADKAVRTGRKVQLEPMPSYERKVIHNALSDDWILKRIQKELIHIVSSH